MKVLHFFKTPMLRQHYTFLHFSAWWLWKVGFKFISQFSLGFCWVKGIAKGYFLCNPPPPAPFSESAVYLRWNWIWAGNEVFNLIFLIAHVFKLFESPFCVFWGPFCVQRQGRDAGEERQSERGVSVCASAQSPILQPKAEIFVFEWIFCR